MSEKEEKEARITVRFPRRDYEFLKRLVEDGEYTNVADVVRDAVKRHRTGWEERRSPLGASRESALLAYKSDLETLGAADWSVAHVSFMLPIHRYQGLVFLRDDSFFFSGQEKDSNEPHVVAFSTKSITDVHYGFDDTYRKLDDRNLGLITAPLRVTFRESNSQKIVYLWIGFNRISRTSSNHRWFETLSALKERGESHVH